MAAKKTIIWHGGSICNCNTWVSTATSTNAWKTAYAYDPNGNLLQITRNDASGTAMDNIAYTYNTSSGRLLNNRLVSVNDPVDGGVGDIYNLHEYSYDEIGNLMADESEGIAQIIWDAYGKIWQIKRTATSTKPELEFRYDGMGNRIMKIVKPQTGGTAQKQEHWAYTIYSRDATGNTIAVYERHWTSALTLTSPNAVATVGVPATGIRFGKDVVAIKVNGSYITNGPVLSGSTATATATNLASAINSYTGGEIAFTAETDGEVVYLLTAASYSQPLSVEILTGDPSWSGNSYFSFGKLNVLGTRPYSGSIASTTLHETVTLAELHLYGSGRLGIKTPNIEIDKKIVKSAYASNYGNLLYLTQLDSRAVTLANPAAGPFFEHNAGLKQYELSNHLGNVLVVFADKKVSHEGGTGVVGHYTASLLNVQDYFPFGWTMPGRTFNGSDYRFGFNGKENDREYGAGGLTQDYGFRMYNPALGRFLSVDPLAPEYPWYTPYQFAGNMPIWAVDLDGLEPLPNSENLKKTKAVLSNAMAECWFFCWDNALLRAAEASTNSSPTLWWQFAHGVANNGNNTAWNKIKGVAGEAFAAKIIATTFGQYTTATQFVDDQFQYINDPVDGMESGFFGTWDYSLTLRQAIKNPVAPNQKDIYGPKIASSDATGYVQTLKSYPLSGNTTFLFEIKTLHPGSTRLYDNILRGYNQAINNAKLNPNAISILFTDAKAYQNMWSSLTPDKQALIRQKHMELTNLNGSLWLYEGFNTGAERIATETYTEIRKETTNESIPCE